MKKKVFSIEIGGKVLTAEFNDLAEQANGSVLVTYGNTVILATVVISKETREGGDFFPLTVDYEEKFYASGQILGSRFVRREGKPSDLAILSGRIVDRTIRPLFDQWIRNEVQAIITVLSLDEDDPDILSVIGVSLALGTSDIPWNGPVSAIRIGKLKEINDLIINPTFSYRENLNSEFELIACGKDKKINMIELGGNETQENIINEALIFASEELEKIQDFQKKIILEIGKEKIKITKPEISQEIINLFKENIQINLENIDLLKDQWLKLVKDKLPDENKYLTENYFDENVDKIVHNLAINENKRVDGRGIDEIRPLYAQAGGISPILHGSGIFYRGQTHILSALTLGGPEDSQIIEGIEGQHKKRFMHHYNFPPFSTGETGKTGGTNRRMIGHGALAEKALEPILPDKDKFPYTIRIVSEALSSNGSTSMGSVCASTLALMDGGVPIKKAVAGIASGLMMRNEKEYKILTDIQGPEDHYGDMDFKVAGTKDGITAIQMDVKVDGIPLHIFPEALEKAKIARQKIIDVILKEIPEVRKTISPKAPEIINVKIKVEQIGFIIGPGGKVINGIKEKSGAESIDIEKDGTMLITGKNGNAKRALEEIAKLLQKYKSYG
ncbi:MAG: polyribonucleotide nucleotidyltransferase [Patescibacteria group bacterium]|nr:polyribonucleotide nucleotidyltransferase [Patescibacteria group bacterium]